MYDKERGLYIAHCANGALSITGKMANRHGLIAGATGTGKTVTLQVMAETFCQFSGRKDERIHRETYAGIRY